MDRYAIFVDAGYVYAAGGELVLDTSNRNRVTLDHSTFIDRVRHIAERDFPRSGDFLRVYWYDAAPRGVAQPEHDSIAAQAGVKVRLGRLTRQGQKGVDSLVLRDMMRLSAEHAICTAFLFAGDEDLRQGVIEAQDYGVKVVLFGIQATFGQNQAESLVQETDDLRVISYEDLEDCFSLASGDQGAILLDEAFDGYGVGLALGTEWARRDPDRAAAAEQAAFVPRDVDAELIRRLLEVGNLPRSAQIPDGVISQAREGFRAALRAPMAPEEPAMPSTASDQPGPTVAGRIASEPAPAAGARELQPTAPTPRPFSKNLEPPPALPDGQLWAFKEGAQFGQEWLDEQPQDEVRYVRAKFPYLPPDVDVELLRRLVTELDLPHGTHIEDADRKAARAGFWQTLGMELDFGSSRQKSRSFESITEGDPVAFGTAFAKQWAERSDSAEVDRARNLLAKRVGLPSEADGVMLRMAAATFGDPVPVDIRHRLREGFRVGLESW